MGRGAQPDQSTPAESHRGRSGALWRSRRRPVRSHDPPRAGACPAFPVGKGVGALVGLTGVLPLSTGARSWFRSAFVVGEIPRRCYSQLVVPRTANDSDDLAGALEEAGVEARWFG